MRDRCKGATVRADDGRKIRVSQILACRKTGERTCEALVHRANPATFSGRSFDRVPADRFRHCRAKFWPDEVRPSAGASAVGGPAEEPPVTAPPVEGSPEEPLEQDQAAAEPGSAPEEEDHMEEDGKRARRFTNDVHGKRLLECVRMYAEEARRAVGGEGFWGGFATWAQGRVDLAPWAASAHAWRVRYEVARYAVSPEGQRHRQQVERLTQVRQRKEVHLLDLARCVDGIMILDQLSGRTPWRPGVLEQVAQLLDLNLAWLVDGTGPMEAVVPAPAPQDPPQGDPPSGAEAEIVEAEVHELAAHDLIARLQQRRRANGGEADSEGDGARAEQMEDSPVVEARGELGRARAALAALGVLADLRRRRGQPVQHEDVAMVLAVAQGKNLLDAYLGAVGSPEREG